MTKLNKRKQKFFFAVSNEIVNQTLVNINFAEIFVKNKSNAYPLLLSKLGLTSKYHQKKEREFYTMWRFNKCNIVDDCNNLKVCF